MRIPFIAFFCIVTFSVTGQIVQAGEKRAADRPPSDNLALGKPYTLSAWPKPPRRGPAPNFQQLLTDGQYCAKPPYPAGLGWVLFTKVSSVDIVVDLGAQHPIGEISARHHADTWRIFMPTKEAYYVSDDGKTFYLAGEQLNTWDPKLPVTEADREKFFKGAKVYTSGPIKAKGRYVMVRTFPSPVTGRPPRLATQTGSTSVYVDEIVVRRGQFAVQSVELDPTRALVRGPLELPPDVLGYRYSAIPWDELFREGPVFLGATPYAYIREDEFHLSVGGVYVSTSGPPSN